MLCDNRFLARKGTSEKSKNLGNSFAAGICYGELSSEPPPELSN